MDSFEMDIPVALYQPSNATINNNDHSNQVASATTSTTASKDRSTHRGLLGMFGRGFFAKSVNHSLQEDYRYLLALDR
uniref:Protein kinase domain-containing protein n=1 Tax=Syphacia muris TaxID=451379 RepID=A0A0N5A8L7_9BILA